MSYKLYDAEIEYLESTGTQYIDTLYKPNGKTRIKAKGRYTHSTLTSSNSMHYLFGVRDGSTFYDMLWNYYRASSKNYFPTYLHYGTDTAEWNNDDRNKDVEVDLSYEGGYYNGEKKLTVIDTANQSNYSLYLLWCNIDGVGQASRKPYGRMHYCKIYENNSLVRDFIPVRVGNVGYMYDKVTGQLFGNSGTGSFVLGPDVAPAAYANEVAFLESWGNQYIDTGIKPSTDTKIELKCLYCKSGAGLTNYGALIGADDRENAYILNHSAVANFTYGLEFSNNFANPQTRLLTFDSTASPQNMRVYDEGGSLVTTLTCLRGVFEVNQNLYLFATNRNGTPVYGSNRILYCKIYDGDTLVRDYVPIEYNGIGYMYDKVSGLFFDNKGTGKFLFGSIAKACARSYTRRQLMAAQEYDYLEKGNLAANTLVSLDINPYNANWQFEGVIEKTGSVAPVSETRMISSRLNNTSYRDIRITFTSNTVFAINVYTRSTYRTTWTVDSNKITFTADYNEATVNEITKSAGTKTGSVYSSAPALVLGDWSQQRCSMAFYSLKAKNNGTLVGDYAVCRRRKDGVIGIMNKVTNNFIVPSRGVITI